MTDTHAAQELAGTLAALALDHQALDVVVDVSDTDRLGAVAYRTRGDVRTDEVRRPDLARSLVDALADGDGDGVKIATAIDPRVWGVHLQRDRQASTVTARVLRRTMLDGFADRR